MELYGYNGFIFHSQDECGEWIAAHGLYIGEEGLLRILENDVELIDSKHDLECFARDNGYTLEELCYEFDIELEETK